MDDRGNWHIYNFTRHTNSIHLGIPVSSTRKCSRKNVLNVTQESSYFSTSLPIKKNNSTINSQEPQILNASSFVLSGSLRTNTENISEHNEPVNASSEIHVDEYIDEEILDDGCDIFNDHKTEPCTELTFSKAESKQSTKEVPRKST
ncbi:uncharacterized protein LOC131431337 [Malaya genurostris]|uniref:uncharacterized protein LOC131431337 n=1 Tax=Malaya genurostris TaxID=325434 RepID=UPI0026F3BBE7|nr:uncharacterized protein LOC131431337 [Malaya genurostris]